MNGHKSTKSHYFQVSDLIDLWQVVITNLEIAVFRVLVSKIVHELSHSLSQVSFVSVELIHDVIDEVLILELELK